MLLVSLLIAVIVAVDIDPKLILPNQLSVWRMGQKELIAWNGSYEQPEYYNNLTRLNVALYQLGNSTQSGKDELLAKVIENYPLTQNNLFWQVPVNISRTKQGVDASTPMYYVKVYPSFFDWTGQCKGCLNKAPRSQLFVILEANCIGDACPVVDPYQGIQHDYSQAIKSVGIAVGVVAGVVFFVSMFLYTKKGIRTIKKLRTKKSGLIYKYNPPVVERLKADNGNTVVSPLRKFFSVDNVTGAHKSPTRQASLVNLGDKIMRDAEMVESARQQSDQKPKIVLDLPPSPPKIYQRDSLLHRASNDNGSQLFEPSENPKLPQEDAMLVASTFRNALRVADLEYSSSSSSTSSYMSQYYTEPPIAAPRFDTMPQSSPVLGRLATKAKEEF